VIFGSMNFSVRGLYVQANNIVVVDDANTAAMFAKAFDVAFVDDVTAPLFRQNPISQGYMTGSATDTPALPKFSLALSPHTNWSVSLGPMAERIRNAMSSVLFAVMEPTGGGPVLASLRTIAAEPTIFSYGTVETDKGLAVQSPNGAMGDITGFAALEKNVPAPFHREFSGGSGMHIHDKFVVVDFSGNSPTVFTGSSNLASGGETQNGDSLVMIEDEAIAMMYAIEAIATFDHYHFRKAMQRATKAEPLTLWYPGKPNQPLPWWKEYYDKTKIQLRDPASLQKCRCRRTLRLQR
jgi:phosphatidylserine/phosphatidylglycerophosphate/cardiolipin synthase-like enzyme